MKLDPKIKHLYWRAGFGIAPNQVARLSNTTLDDEVNKLLLEAVKVSQQSISDAGTIRLSDYKKSSRSEKKMMRKEEQMNVANLGVDWILRMSDTEGAPFLEKMCLFWHGHFACIIKGSKITHQYLSTIRKHAFGNFRDLLLGIAKEPAMIRFLNNQQNRKSSPNENFARELLELFTLGIGNYSEQDIKEAARAFTGWSSTKEGDFVFKERTHDFDKKSFMGELGDFNGDDIIDIILKQKQTARFICTKVYKYFVNEKVNEKHVESLANTFYNSNYDIADLMKMLLTSSWFYEAKNYGTKIKSPVELIAGLINTLDIDFENPIIVAYLGKVLGQQLFKPPNVAGWNGGKSWIDNSTLMFRLNLASFIINKAQMDQEIKKVPEDKVLPRKLKAMEASVNFDPIQKLVKGKSKEEAFDLLTEIILQDTSKVDAIRSTVLNNNTDTKKYIIAKLMSLPEYQMC